MPQVFGSNELMEDVHKRDLCIGCGACVPTCKDKAIKLLQKEEQVAPPISDKEMYKKIMIERFGLGGTIKFAAKAALGLKI